MEVLETRKTLQEYLLHLRQKQLRIAFVPTMGALHQGHIALIRHAHTVADIVVCSIFVNPTQFNDPEDLKKYPRPIEADIRKLREAGCHVLFHPAVTEMYGPNEQWHLDLGDLDKILEARHRPGHFQGVTQIVKKLFDIVQPDVACFGQKDFQQVKVIELMIARFGLPVQLSVVPTVRESDGLAMSSRNVRLSPTGRQQALALYTALQQIKAGLAYKTPTELQRGAQLYLEASPGVTVEYVAICDAQHLTPITGFSSAQQAVALVAAWVDGVRLIDNMLLT